MDTGPVGTTKRQLARVADLLGLIERYLTAILMIVMTALYAFNVLIRMVLPTHASTFAWIDEATRYMMIWVVFLAAGVTLEIGRHVSVDLIRPFLRPRALTVLFIIIDIVGLLSSLAAMVFSFNLAVFVANTGQISPTLGIPTYVLYVAPTLGFASLAFRFLLRLINIRDARRAPVAADWLGGVSS